MLHDGDVSFASLLVQTLVVPLRVDAGKFRSDTVVLTHEQILNAGETEILVGSSFSGSKALAALVSVTATSISGLHQEWTSGGASTGLQLTSLESSELSAAVLAWSIDLRTVDE